ncbi:MAG: hypothetical protein H7321_03395 [Bacteroidia bacterium]|nr:hypothetical protein [Bacteroidia bacterium]
MKKIIILLLILVSLNSCESFDKEQVVRYQNKYTLSIPDYLTKATNLNDEASLQYMNGSKEFYVIVIDESKSELNKALVDNNLTEQYEDNIQGYANLLIDGFEATLKSPKKSKIIDTVINKLPARLLTFTGTVEGIDAFYTIAFIEGKETYYQIMSWTLMSKQDEYKEKMSKIMYSFKEL